MGNINLIVRVLYDLLIIL